MFHEQNYLLPLNAGNTKKTATVCGGSSRFQTEQQTRGEVGRSKEREDESALEDLVPKHRVSVGAFSEIRRRSDCESQG